MRPLVARSRDRVRPSCSCGPSLCGSIRRAMASCRRRSRVGGSLGPGALFTLRTEGGKTVEIVAPLAAARPGDRVGVLPSRRAGGGIHLFQGDQRVTSRGRRGSSPAALLAVLAWLVVYPIVLVLLEGVHGPAAGHSIRADLRGTAHRVARAVGQPLDLARERAARRRHRPAARRSLLPLRLPRRSAPRRAGRAPGRSPAARRRARLPLSLWRDAASSRCWSSGCLGLEEPPWRLEGAGAILLVHAYSMYVYFYLFTRAGLASLDASLLEAAASLGAGRWRTFRRVVLPLLYPAHRRRGAAHVHDVARLLQRALHLRRRLPGDDHADRGDAAQWRQRARDGRDDRRSRSSRSRLSWLLRGTRRAGVAGGRAEGARRPRWFRVAAGGGAGLARVAWGLARCCCCPTSRCCSCPSCRSGPGRWSRSRRCTRSGTISR